MYLVEAWYFIFLACIPNIGTISALGGHCQLELIATNLCRASNGKVI